MRLEQRLTPQMLQSMAVLQKPVSELETYIEQALESNAALEVDESRPSDSEDSKNKSSTPDHRQGDGAFRRLNQFRSEQDSDWSASDGARRRRTSSSDMDAKMGAMANTP